VNITLSSLLRKSRSLCCRNRGFTDLPVVATLPHVLRFL